MNFDKIQIELGPQLPVFVSSTVSDSLLDIEPARFVDDDVVHWGSVGMDYMPSRVDAAHMAEFANVDAVYEASTRGRGKNPDAAGFDCLSASVVGDDDAVRAAVARAAGVDPQFAVTPIGSLLAALEALKARRVWFVSPYDLTLTESVAGLVHHNGYEVHGAYADLSEGIYRVPPKAIRKLASGARRVEADVIVLLCTNLRTAKVIRQLEAASKTTVISAHSVYVWAGVSAAYKATGLTQVPTFLPALGSLGQVRWPGNPDQILKP